MPIFQYNTSTWNIKRGVIIVLYIYKLANNKMHSNICVSMVMWFVLNVWESCIFPISKYTCFYVVCSMSSFSWYMVMLVGKEKRSNHSRVQFVLYGTMMSVVHVSSRFEIQIIHHNTPPLLRLGLQSFLCLPLSRWHNKWN